MDKHTIQAMMARELTRQEAELLAESNWWESGQWSERELVEVQLFQERCCMSFSRFHKALEVILGRPVYAIEFGNAESLRQEFKGLMPAPSITEIIDQIPPHKRLIFTPKDL